MASTKIAYGTQNTSITLTVTSLASAAGRASTAVDNTSNLFLDALVAGQVKTNASGTSATGYVTFWAYGTADGSNYTDGVTGTDAAFTPASTTNLRFLGTANAVANATTYTVGPFSMAAAFGGSLPEKWGIVIVNNTGATLDASTGAMVYQGVYSTTV